MTRQSSLLATDQEVDVQARIRLAVGDVPHARLFRNSVGEGWIGKVVDRTEGTLTLLRPRRVPFGLFPGSADLVGWTSVTITPDMVGTKVAVFTSGEVKKPTIRDSQIPEEQVQWRNNVLAAGGRAAFLRTEAEALLLVRVP